MVKLYIYIGIAAAAFWASFLEGRKHGIVGSMAGSMVGVCIGLIYFYLSHLLGKWCLKRLDRAKTETKIYRLFLGVGLGIMFFIWLCSAYSVGSAVSSRIMIIFFGTPG